MAVDDVWFERSYSIFEYLGKSPFVLLEITSGEIAKLCAFVGHYIAHPYDLIGDMAPPELYEHASVLINAVEFSRPVVLDGCDQEVIMVACQSFSQHGLQIYAAAG